MADSGPRYSVEFLESCGWSNAEFIWEQIQDTAAQCVVDASPEEAIELREGGLEVAKESFQPGDLRLATSLANCGIGERYRGRESAAEALFTQAVSVWDSGDSWVAALTPEVRARSSTFHLRLERKHTTDAYSRFSKNRFCELATEGRAAIDSLMTGETGRTDRFARWQRDRPEGFNDLRKLMGAVFLLG